MSTAENLLVELAEHGLALVIEGEACAVVAALPDATTPRGLVPRLRKAKAELLALCVCGECGRVTTSLEDMRILATNPALCDRAFLKGDRNRPSSGCPYKDRYAPPLPPMPAEREEERSAPTTRSKKKPNREDQGELFDG